MKLSLIVAVSDDNVIGQNNTLPWHLPKDLIYFKKLTLGKPIVMGRKTFESIGKLLPGRQNIILSGSNNLILPEGVIFNDRDTLINYLQGHSCEEAFIIGGGKIFETFMNCIDTMYITRVHAGFPDGDVFFPEVDHTHWKLVWEEMHPKDEKNIYNITFQRLERVEM